MYLGAGPAGGGGGGGGWGRVGGRGGPVCEGKRNRADSGVASRGAPAFRLQPLLTLSRGGDRSHLSYFSLVIWSSRECHQARARPGLPVVEAPVPGPPAGSEPLAARPDGSVLLQLLVA